MSASSRRSRRPGRRLLAAALAATAPATVLIGTAPTANAAGQCPTASYDAIQNYSFRQGVPWASGNYRYQRYLISDGHSFRAEVWRETTGGRPYVFTRDGGCTYYEDNLDNDDPVEIDELAPQVGAGVDVNAPRTSSRWTLFPSSFTPIRTGTVHVGKPVTVETLPK